MRIRRAPHFDFVGRRRTWWLVSGVIVLTAALSLTFRQLNLSIEFLGGSSFTLSGISTPVTAAELEGVAAAAGAVDPQAQLVQEGLRVTGAIVQTAAVDPGSPAETAIAQALQQRAQASAAQVSFVGPTWGERISKKMLQALAAFLLAIVAYISIRLQFKMSIAALIALVHDIVITAGVYSLFQFKVSPETIIAFLTVLGYSLYDTVVVFDRVDETMGRLGGAGRRTFSEAVNTSMNEVFWRSLNTSFMAVLPVLALLVIGAQVLGAKTLQDLAIALVVGMISGVYSSLFIAGPFLAAWREREPEMVALAKRAERREVDAAEQPVTVPVTVTETDGLEPAATPGAAVPRDRAQQRDRVSTGYVRGPGRKPRRKRR